MGKKTMVTVAALALGMALQIMASTVQPLTVSVPGNPAAAQQINATLAKVTAKAERFAARFDKMGQNRDSQGAYYNAALHLTYQDAKYTSVIYDTESWTGSTDQPRYSRTGYVFDNATGRALSFRDFASNRWRPETTNIYIIEALNKMEIGIHLGAAQQLINDGNHKNYYLNAEGVPVYVFNPGEVHQARYGVIEVTLPPA